MKTETLETLTVENVRVGLRVVCKDHPEWGVHVVGRDRNGWTRKSRSGEAMLWDHEFHFWALAGE